MFRYAIGVCALGIAYYASGLVALSLYDVRAIALIWFPSAIAFAVVVLYGIRYAPAIVAGTFALVVTRGLPLKLAVAVSVSNVLEICVGALVLVRILHFRPALHRVRDTVALSLVAFIMTSVGAGAIALFVVGLDLVSDQKFGEIWSMWWWTHLGGDLVVTPAILTVVCHSRLPRREQRLTAVEGLAISLCGFGIVLAILARRLPSLMALSTPPYYVLPMLLWAAMRFGPRGAAVASLSTNVVAIGAQSLGVGPFGELLDLQSFVTISTVGTLIVGAFAVERADALEEKERTLRFARDRLEAEVIERTADLTAANRALARRDQEMRQAASLARFGSFEVDIASGRVHWSDELHALFGLVPGTFEPTVERFLQAFVPSDRDRIGVQVSDAIRDVRRFEFKGTIHRPDGSERTLRTLGCVITNEGSKPVRLFACCQDVTELELAERMRARLAQLVESSDDAIIGLTLGGTIETWNSGASSLFGYAAGETIGKPCVALLVPPDEQEGAERGLAAARAGEHAWHHESPHVRKNGEVFPASVTTSAVLDTDNTVVGLSKVIRDMTSEKAVDAQLRASLHEKEVLLHEIHHRVKNNLQVIASLLRLESSKRARFQRTNARVSGRSTWHGRRSSDERRRRRHDRRCR